MTGEHHISDRIAWKHHRQQRNIPLGNNGNTRNDSNEHISTKKTRLSSENKTTEAVTVTTDKRGTRSGP